MPWHWRSAENRARDQWRHPAQTLALFGDRQDQRTVEITPGNGWCSGILAPWLRQQGQYADAVHVPADGEYVRKSATSLKTKYAADPERYSKVEWLEFKPTAIVFGAPSYFHAFHEVAYSV